MKFSITFTLDNEFIIDDSKPQGVLFKSSCNFGTDLIKELKNKYNANYITADMITDDTLCSLRYSYECKITEKMANKCSHFKNKANIIVKIPPNYLDNYQYIDHKTIKPIYKRFCKKCITEIHITNKVNDNNIFEDWEKDGFPLNWN